MQIKILSTLVTLSALSFNAQAVVNNKCSKALIHKSVLARLSTSGIGRNEKVNSEKFANLRNIQSPIKFLEVGPRSSVITPEAEQLAPLISFFGRVPEGQTLINVGDVSANVQQSIGRTDARYEFTITGPRYRDGGLYAKTQSISISKSDTVLLNKSVSPVAHNLVAISKDANFVTLSSFYNSDSLIGSRGKVEIYKIETLENGEHELTLQRELGAGRLKNFFLNNSEFNSLVFKNITMSPKNDSFVVTLETLSQEQPTHLMERILRPKMHESEIDTRIEGRKRDDLEDSWGRKINTYTFHYDIKTDRLTMLWSGDDFSNFSPNGRFVIQTQARNARILAYDSELQIVKDIVMAKNSIDDGSAKALAVTDQGTVYYYNTNKILK